MQLLCLRYPNNTAMQDCPFPHCRKHPKPCDRAIRRHTVSYSPPLRRMCCTIREVWQRNPVRTMYLHRPMTNFRGMKTILFRNRGWKREQSYPSDNIPMRDPTPSTPCQRFRVRFPRQRRSMSIISIRISVWKPNCFRLLRKIFRSRNR